MLVKALYDFAGVTKTSRGTTLLESPEFNARHVPWIIDLDADGTLLGFIPMMTQTEPGRFFVKLPRPWICFSTDRAGTLWKKAGGRGR